jgi:hypothetical protein
MRTCLFVVSIACTAFAATGCMPSPEPAAQSDSATLSAVVTKAEDIAQLIGPGGFGGPQFSGYQQHMGPMMGFLDVGALADPNGTVRVQFWNQAGSPCTFHLAYVASYDQLQQQVQDITVEPGQVATFDLPCSEMVGLGDLTQVGTPAGTLGSGAPLDNQFCVPGFLNSDYRCGGTFACFLSADVNDLDSDGDTQESVITTQPFQQHAGPAGMMGHGHMMGGWR